MDKLDAFINGRTYAPADLADAAFLFSVTRPDVPRDTRELLDSIHDDLCHTVLRFPPESRTPSLSSSKGGEREALPGAVAPGRRGRRLAVRKSLSDMQ